MHVRPTERVVVPFSGEGAGTGELSWGQREIWTAMVASESAKPVGGAQPVPTGTSVERVAGELQFIMNRYPAMRTRLRFDGTAWPQQVVSASGETALEIFEAGDHDPAALAEVVCERYRRTP